ncbi:unnamed protein product [Mytilus edulis]|uniref:Mitochondria-eating protein C-terminal domain-containing protein n=1 Tax=Mytilus edulis TaxID=6550 RepID=A0A8S3T8G9_MYTED|nr:unnamed protein product [Mytilus edulis]
MYTERLPEYVNKCIEICWLMNTHNPPLEFAEPPMSGQPYDKDSYEEFTVQGDTVSFVVWLPLLIEKDGAILTKGVVQPIAKSFSTSVSEKKRNISVDKMKDSSHLPYSTNTRRTTTTSGSAYKYLPSSEPATKTTPVMNNMIMITDHIQPLLKAT